MTITMLIIIIFILAIASFGGVWLYNKALRFRMDFDKGTDQECRFFSRR